MLQHILYFDPLCGSTVVNGFVLCIIEVIASYLNDMAVHSLLGVTETA